MALSFKQKTFIEAYIGEARGNASEAARIAGYKLPRQQGYENLTKPDIRAEIDKELALRTLSASEVLSRITEHANGTLKHFLKPQGDEIIVDLTSDEADANFHLLKKAKTKRRTGGTDEAPWTEVEVEIEIHDPQAALRDLGRYHKLFTDKMDVTANGQPLAIGYSIVLPQGGITDDAGTGETAPERAD